MKRSQKHQNVFMGVSVDGVAIEFELQYLKKTAIDFGAHFWITDRSDYKQDR